MAYNMQELLKKWAGEEVTVEQAIGQLLLTVEAQGKALEDLTKRVRALETAARHAASPDRLPTGNPLGASAVAA